MTAVRKRLAAARLEIAGTRASTSRADCLWTHSAFCVAALPHERVPERLWQRKVGTTAVRIEAGGVADLAAPDGWRNMPLPYGRYPRLVLFHLCSEVMRTGRAEVSMEDTLTGFLASLGVDPNGRALRDLRAQLAPLAVASVRLWTADASSPDGVRKTDLWAGPVDPERRARWVHAWPSKVRLSEEFVRSLRANAVPLDRRAVTALMHSSAALDAMGWVEHALQAGMTDITPWDDLWRRFGPGFKLIRQFRFAFRADLELVRGLCPHAKIDITNEGVMIGPSSREFPRVQLTLPGF